MRQTLEWLTTEYCMTYVECTMNMYIYIYKIPTPACYIPNVRVPPLYMIVQHRRLHKDCLQPTWLIGLYWQYMTSEWCTDNGEDWRRENNIADDRELTLSGGRIQVERGSNIMSESGRPEVWYEVY